MHRIPAPYFLAASLLGGLAIINLVWLRNYGVSTGIAIILYAIVLTVAFFAGRFAKARDLRPGLYSAEVGALFGIIAGLGSFLIRDTLRDINMPNRLALRLRLVEWANSPGGHIAADVTAMIAFGVLSLVVGSIGGASRGPRSS